MTKNTAIVAYRLVSEAKLAKLDTQDKFVVIRAIGKLKPTATAFDDFLKEARERLKPDGWAEIEKKAQGYADMDAAAKAEIDKAISAYNKVVADCAEKELQEPFEGEYERLTEEQFGKLMDSNPEWSVQQILAVQEALC